MERNNELLPSPLPMKLKVAFLSVVYCEMAFEGTAAARSALNLFMISTIFQFAAKNLRRRIICHPSFY